MLNKLNILFVGVGGQGILTASDIAAQVGLDLGLDAKKSEVHGFAQRGGVVESHVRWAPLVGSPTCEKGQVDVLVASLMSLLEPIMILVLGTIVGVIVLAIFLPMVKIITGLMG